jgi:type I restriction enzyme S subunit
MTNEKIPRKDAKTQRFEELKKSREPQKLGVSASLREPEKQNGKPVQVPKLRFPKFREPDTWQSVTLGSVLTEHCLKSDGASEVHSVSLTHGVVSQLEHMGRSYAAADTSHYSLVRPFDVVYTRSPLAIFRLGIVKQHRRPITAIISPLYGVFAPANRHIGYIIEAFFESPSRSVNYLDPLAQKGAKNTIQLSNERFLSGRIVLPTSEPEQQKIAECLSSVDELMAAQSRKLDAIKTHKKGLMQQLFPREGETQPRLRFPEFQNAGDWDVKALAEIVEVASGQVDPKEPPYSDFPQIGSENIESNTGKLVNVKSAGDKGVISGNYAFDENDVLYSKIRPALNKVAAPAFMGICSADIYPIRPANGGLLRCYLLYLLLSQKFLEYAIRNSERGKIPKINRDGLLAYEALIPSPPEQQRIADCLTSLDDLIAAQTQKLEALKTHKKGLMQQLFPSREEVEV